MGAIRGIVDDYERWADQLGCPGWGWPEMLDAFLRVEDDLDFGGDGLHGKGGPIPLSRVPFDELSPLDGALRTAMAGLGFPFCDDYHAVDATGVSRARAHAAQRPARLDQRRLPRTGAGAGDLEVRGGVLVDRVIFDGRCAIGVRSAGGEEIAADEVIVSAGAIHSPAILLRSGVGLDDGLPVGANLKDHAATPGFEIALKPAGRMLSPNAPMLTSMLRYSSGLVDAGPNDMQMVWFAAVGPTDDALAGGRLIGAIMRELSRRSATVCWPSRHQ